jgi:ribosomal protein S18 acetylase RimI-like enzyme
LNERRSALIEIRALNAADVPKLLVIQLEAYPPALQENAGTFEDKLSLRPPGAFGAFLGAALCGYVISHPWTRDRVVPLGLARTVLPEKADCVYIHDLAISAAFRGMGIARLLVSRVFDFGNRLDLDAYTLMAVQSSESFWSRFGFRVVERIEYVPGVIGSEMIREPSGPDHRT